MSSASRCTVSHVAAVLLALGWVMSLAPLAPAQEAPGARPCLRSGIPADYGTFLSLRSTRFRQNPGQAPVESAASHHLELIPPSAYAVTNVGVSGPGGFKAPLTRLPDGSSTWSALGSEAALGAQSPAGNYNASFLLAFPNGDSFIGFFPFTLASNTPPVPRISNLEAAQEFPATERFAIQWTPWLAAGTQDRIEFQVRDESGTLLFSAASDCASTNALATGASQIELPSGLLSPGSAATGYLTFGGAQLVGADDNSLIAQRGFHARTTSFPLRARASGGTGSPATLSQPGIAGTNLIFQLAGTPGARYAVESSLNLRDWTKVSEVTIPGTGSVAVTVALPSDGVPRFYRATPIPGGGGTVTPGPATLALALAGERLLQLTLSGTPSATYAVESTANYSNWTSVTNVTLPASASPTAVLTVRIPVAPGTDFLAFRARGVDAPVTPPVLKPGTLAITRADALITLSLSGATPLATYAVQQHTADWVAGTWQSSEITITTDAAGAGSKSVPASAAGGTAIFYRSIAP